MKKSKTKTKGKTKKERHLGIGKLARKLILQGKVTSEVCDGVLREFPESKINSYHIAWYRKDMKEHDVKIPDVKKINHEYHLKHKKTKEVQTKS